MVQFLPQEHGDSQPNASDGERIDRPRMDDQGTVTSGKVKARRFRFSIRTLAIMVAIFCAYLACWGPTKRFAANIDRPSEESMLTFASGRNRQQPLTIFADAPLPLVLRLHELVPLEKPRRTRLIKRYYFWFFGPKIKLPIETYGKKTSDVH